MWLALGLTLLLVPCGIAALLAIPVDLRFRGSLGDAIEGEARVDWLWGLVGRDLRRGPKQKEPEKEPAPRSFPTRAQLRALGDPGLRARLATLLERAQRWISVEEVYGRIRLGLGDPADTGMSMGWILPLFALLNRLPRTDLQLTPDFTRTVFAGELRGALRAVPLGLLVAAVPFIVARETRAVIRAFRAKPAKTSVPARPAATGT